MKLARSPRNSTVCAPGWRRLIVASLLRVRISYSSNAPCVIPRSLPHSVSWLRVWRMRLALRSTSSKAEPSSSFDGRPSPRKIAHRVWEMTGDRENTDGMEVTLELADELPPVLGDPDQLQQVLLNLSVNALQAVGTR